MMKTIIFIVTMFTLFVSTMLSAQTFFGQWEDQAGNRIIFNENKSIDFFDTNNTYKSGQYAIQNDLLYLELNGVYFTYRVTSYDGNNMSIVDAEGNNIAMSKVNLNKPLTTQELIEQQSNTQLYQTMMKMNTQSHVTSLNIIENIGGTGTYWKIDNY